MLFSKAQPIAGWVLWGANSNLCGDVTAELEEGLAVAQSVTKKCSGLLPPVGELPLPQIERGPQ